VWDTATGQELFTLVGHQGWINGVAFSPDGTRLATGSYDGTARVWDAATGRELLTLTGHQSTVLAVTFSPDGGQLATASYDGTAKIWDTAPGRELLTLVGHAGSVEAVATSPDGRHLVTASGDGKVKMWDAATGQELLTLPEEGYTGPPFRSVAYRPECVSPPEATAERCDALLAAGTVEGTMIVWRIEFNPAGDVISGHELLTLAAHDNWVFGLAFSPECVGPPGASAERCGTRLVTSGFDGTARIYVLPIEELVALAQSRVTRSLTTEECQRFLHVDACPAGP